MAYPLRTWSTDSMLSLTELSCESGGVLEEYSPLLIGASIFDRMHAEDVEKLRAEIYADGRANLSFRDAICRFSVGDGITLTVELTGTPLCGPDDKFAGYRGTARAIGGFALESLDRSVPLLETVYARAPIALCVLDRTGRFIAVNDRHTRALSARVGQCLSDFHPESLRKLLLDFEHLDKGGVVPDHDIRIGDKIFAVSVSPLTDVLGNIVAVSVAHFDVTERRSLEEKLREANRQLMEMTLRDHLTGTFNRRYFDTSFEEEERRIGGTGGDLSLILIDIDRFKVYNDTYGHIAGDRCLIAVAGAMSTALHRASDALCRYGGEEFAVLLPNTDLHGAEVVAERLRRAVEALDLPHEGSPPHNCVTISAGVASRSWPERQAEKTADIVLAADRALYEAKTRGRNRVWLGA